MEILHGRTEDITWTEYAMWMDGWMDGVLWRILSCNTTNDYGTYTSLCTGGILGTGLSVTENWWNTLSCNGRTLVRLDLSVGLTSQLSEGL